MCFFRKSKVVLVLAATLVGLNGHTEDKTESSFYFGIGGGYHMSHMSISHLDKNIYPDTKGQGSGLFDIFLQYEFGRKKEFGVRLEVDFLRRGGSLHDIYNTAAFGDLYQSQGVSDISYDLRSKFTDIRLPLIYQFCGPRSVLRPYVYIAPILGFSTSGRIKAQTDFVDGAYAGSELSLTKGNFRSVDFAGAIGAGLKYDLNLYGHPFYVGVELNYQIGFTDTYSSKEKAGDAVVKDNFFQYAYNITGSRRFNGFEIKGSLSIPMSIFVKKKAPAAVEVEEEWTPAPEPNPVAKTESVEEPPCRSIDEVSVMIRQGKDVRGVTFCSIDDIRFETGKSALYPSSYDYLGKLASILKQTGMSIEVKGHTDNTGTHDFNAKLSKDRAMAVVDYLKKAGVPKKQLSYSYYGETEPLSDNSTERGRSINRRVEFEIK